MNPILITLIVVVGCSLGFGLFIAAVAWNSSRRNRRAPTPSKPYTDVQTSDANRWPVNDFDPQAGLDRLRAALDAARAADPTSAANLRPIPGQRKESQ